MHFCLLGVNICLAICVLKCLLWYCFYSYEDNNHHSHSTKFISLSPTFTVTYAVIFAVAFSLIFLFLIFIQSTEYLVHCNYMYLSFSISSTSYLSGMSIFCWVDLRLIWFIDSSHTDSNETNSCFLIFMYAVIVEIKYCITWNLFIIWIQKYDKIVLTFHSSVGI